MAPASAGSATTPARDAPDLPRLSAATLARLPDTVRRPAYDVGAAPIGVVHLGLGAFHRAHQAIYFDDLLARRAGAYGVLGASLRSPAVAAQLVPQDGLYLLRSLADGDASLRLVGAVREACFAADDPTALVRRMARPEVHLFTLTVTEKGYCHRPADGTLDLGHPDIAHDLAHPDAPRSAPGLLVAALALRRAQGAPAPNILCCDNLPANGRVLRGLVLALAARTDPALADWIAAHAAFPCTMVDRIVPATTEPDRAAVAAAVGLRDEGLVKAEPFSQWVVEARFAGAPPPLDAVGATVVDDVAPWELAKLRMLNGAHSAIAYLGVLAGLPTVADAMRVPALRRFIERLLADEVAPTLPAGRGPDPVAYRRALLARFANGALQHRTAQIAMDGSQKLPQRLLGTLRDRLAARAPFDRLALAVAAWMRHLEGTDDQGAPIAVDDPLAARLRAALDGAGAAPEARVAALLAQREVFPEALAADPRVRTALTDAFASLRRHGVRAVLEVTP
jgi:fructuronate reductase